MRLNCWNNRVLIWDSPAGSLFAPRITGIARNFLPNRYAQIRVIRWRYNNQRISRMKQFPCGMHFYSWDPRDSCSKKESQMYCVLMRISQWTFKKWSLYFCCLNTNCTDRTNIICEILRFAWGIVSTDHEYHEENQCNPYNHVDKKSSVHSVHSVCKKYAQIPVIRGDK